MSVIGAGSSRQSDPSQEYGDSASILRLNDDCLMHLFSFLTLDEQVNMAETCARLNGILEIIFRTKKSLIASHKELTYAKLEKILITAGHYLHQLKVSATWMISDYSKFNFKLMSQMCKNLKELHLTHIWIPGASLVTLKEIGLNLHYLTKIELISCNIYDVVCKNLVALKNIEYINLSENENITGKYLNGFTKLVHLDLAYCTNTEPCFFKNICENRLLKWLNIMFCSKLYNDDGLYESLSKLEQLEELLVGDRDPTNKDGINNISLIKSLTALTIYNPDNFNEDVFKELVQNKSDKLESLELVTIFLGRERLGNICKLTNLKKLKILNDQSIRDEFVQRISNLKQLKYLGLCYCRTYSLEGLLKLFEQQTKIVELDIVGNYLITNEDVFKIADKIRARGTKSPCAIRVKWTPISEDILKDTRYMEYAPFVKLSLIKD